MVSLREFTLGDVTPKYGDAALIICCFITGMVDAATFNSYFCFVGMQTGNTVILGLSTAGYPIGQPHAWLATLVSIASFLTGAVFTFIVARRAGPLRRVTVALEFFLQGCLILVSAGLATGNVAPKNTWRIPGIVTDVDIVIAIPALAFQFGSQIATSRMLGYNELPTTVLTSTYADLAGDANFFSWPNVKRDRRLAAVILQLLGAILGAWIQRAPPGMITVYWLGGGMKILIGIAVFLFMVPVKQKSIPKPDLPVSDGPRNLAQNTQHAKD